MNTECFEPIGSNCEFGFVLRELGDNRPSLFRWTAINVADFVALLNDNFLDCFERSTVRPHTPEMVMSVPHRWAFHSALHSSPEGEFTAPADRFARLFEIERARVMYAIEQFTRRLTEGGIVATFSAPELHDEDGETLLAAIDRYSGHQTNRVLIVGPPADGEPPPGGLRAISNRAARGTVAWLPSYDRSDAADYDNWRAILAQVTPA